MDEEWIPIFHPVHPFNPVLFWFSDFPPSNFCFGFVDFSFQNFNFSAF